ncbi:hypothetical protein [Kitasatospora sp. NPDC097691]|uniref:hypothetical protein n=1 Tax=Kitasatospora sp. NPDC097691 TaxID=3157231 RepID=UPI003323350F
MTVLAALATGCDVRRLTLVNRRAWPLAGRGSGEREWLLRHPGRAEHGPVLRSRGRAAVPRARRCPEGAPLSLGLVDGDVWHVLPASPG